MSGPARPFSQYFGLGLYVAAARSDLIGKPDKASVLRREVLLALEAYRAYEIDDSGVMDVVDSVMGPDWAPSGEWKNQLDALGFTRGNLGK